MAEDNQFVNAVNKILESGSFTANGTLRCIAYLKQGVADGSVDPATLSSVGAIQAALGAAPEGTLADRDGDHAFELHQAFQSALRSAPPEESVV